MDEHLTKTGAIREFVSTRTAGWIISAVATFILLFILVMELTGVNTAQVITRVFWGNKSEPKTESGSDPVGIVGKWTYTTSFDSETDSKKHKYKEVQGVNFLIKFDAGSYAMQGQRTHYMEKNSNKFQKYPSPITIKISRTGFTPDLSSFFFFFEVQGDDLSAGFVELQIEKSNKSTMDGVVHYLHNDRTWSKALIHFERQST